MSLPRHSGEVVVRSSLSHVLQEKQYRRGLAAKQTPDMDIGNMEYQQLRYWIYTTDTCFMEYK